MQQKKTQKPTVNTKEDPNALLHEAGKRIFTQDLLQQLISEASLPLEICLEFDAIPDPIFWIDGGLY